MTTEFDQIYVITFVKNANRRKFMINQFDMLNISNYNFIYGIDINSLQDLLFNSEKHAYYGNNLSYNIHGLSCGIAHLTALQHAQSHKYNKILICEDDIKFINDINYIKYLFNNHPKDADIIRFNTTLFNNINNIDKNLIVDNLYYDGIFFGNPAGATCYGIYNTETINNMIDSYIHKSIIADWLDKFDSYKIYSTIKMPCIETTHQKIDKYYKYNDDNLYFDYENNLLIP